MHLLFVKCLISLLSNIFSLCVNLFILDEMNLKLNVYKLFRRCYMAEILPIRRKHYPINQYRTFLTVYQSKNKMHIYMFHL